MSEGRSPLPCDVEAEQCTLACMLLDQSFAAAGCEMVRPGDFSRPSHSQIFEAIRTVLTQGKPVDLYIVKDELDRRDILEQVGGVAYLMAIQTMEYQGARIQHYANIVLDKSMLRQLMTTAAEINDLAKSGATAGDVQDKAVEKLLSMRRHEVGRGFISLQDAVSGALTRIEETVNRRGAPRGPILGLSVIDNLTMGMDPGVTIIAGATGIGKTSLLLQIARASAHLRGAMFELEMDAEQLADRMLMAESRLDSHQVRQGVVADPEWDRLVMAANELCGVNLYINEDATDVTGIMSAAHRAILQHKVDYILIDYIGLIEPPDGKRSESRNLELGAIGRGLKKLSRGNSVPVIVACQLSRKWQDRKNPRPALRDLRDSGELEQHADRVIFAHDPSPNVNDAGSGKILEVDLAKNRYGPKGMQEVWWEGKTFSFSNIERTHKEEDYVYRGTPRGDE